MKIEKVNENQIRCTLSREELADRQIKLSELAYGSEKAKTLFRDMIEQANYEFGFEVDDIPLMIEAIPLSGENIILQITKVEYPEELDTRFSRFSEGGEDEGASSTGEEELFSATEGADDILDIFKKMKEGLEEPVQEKESSLKNPGQETRKEPPKTLVKMYEARKIAQLERLAKILDGFYQGKNDLYKDENKNRYYLLLHKSAHSPEEFNKVCNIVSEYAKQVKYTPATEAFLREHGKLIIKGNALQVIGEI